ncbi:MAG TPA: hypothetical protein VGW39_05205 [Chthoniobacterales bacterium]|nr:hypothetical protein [Chthoniobacterales bacterium]
MHWPLRLANEADIPALETLIERSVRELQSAHYSAAQMDGALGSVFGVDRQLIQDKTYFAAASGARFFSRAKMPFAPGVFARSNWSRLCPACPFIERSTTKPVSATKCRS